LKLIECTLERSSAGVFTQTELSDLVAGRYHAARDRDTLQKARQLRIRLGVILFVSNQVAHQPFHFRQQTFGFWQGKKSWHVLGDEYSAESPPLF
jgi:hypothetical protein